VQRGATPHPEAMDNCSRSLEGQSFCCQNTQSAQGQQSHVPEHPACSGVASVPAGHTRAAAISGPCAEKANSTCPYPTRCLADLYKNHGESKPTSSL